MKQPDTTTPAEPVTEEVSPPPKEKTVTLKEGAALLVARILAEPDAEKRLADTVACFLEVQRVAIHEAAIVLQLGGLPALHRLFHHHGIDGEPC